MYMTIDDVFNVMSSKVKVTDYLFQYLVSFFFGTFLHRRLIGSLVGWLIDSRRRLRPLQLCHPERPERCRRLHLTTRYHQRHLFVQKQGQLRDFTADLVT